MNKMNLALASLALIATASLASVSQAESLCGKSLPCGTFEGPMTETTNGKEEVLAHETMILSDGPVENSLKMEGHLTDLDGKTVIWKYSYVLNFEADGAFVINKADKKFAAGFCTANICSYTFRPTASGVTSGAITALEDGTLVRGHANQYGTGEPTLAISKMTKK